MANDKKFIVKNGLLTPENAVIGTTTDNGVDQLQVTGTTNLSGEASISSNTASSATLDVHNFLGAGSSTIVATFRGDSDALQVKNIGTGDYSIVNTQQNNGIIFYDSTPGVVIQYNGSDRLNIDSTGNHFTGLSTTDIDGNRIITTADEGPGNGFDADTVDGLEAASFLRSDADDTGTGNYIFTKDLTVNQNVQIDGDLTVSGNTTYVDTETILLSDNIITLNANHSGAPTQNAGWEVNRGSSANSGVLWDETNDWFKLNSAGNDLGRIITTADEGPGNGFDADTVDGLEGAQFLRSDVDDTANGVITFANSSTIFGDGTGAVTITYDVSGNNRQIYVNAGVWGILNQTAGFGMSLDSNDDLYINRDIRANRHITADDNITSTAGNIEATAGSVTAGTTVNAGTNVVAGGTVTGTQFIDADDSGYYLNPNDTSILQTVGIDDNLIHNGNQDTRLAFTTDTIKLDTDGTTRLTANNTGVHIDNLNVGTLIADSGSFNTEVESPIYYDKDDRNYYGDFAGDSQMNTIDIDDYVRHRGDTNTYFGFNGNDQAVIYTGGTEALFANNTIVRTTRTLQVSKFQDADDPSYEVDPAGTSIMNTIGIDDYIFHNGDTDTYFGFNANDNYQIFTGGTQRLEVNGTFITGAVDGFFPNLYAARYYDSGNATYYGDFASTSRVNDISLVGQIIHDGDTDTYLDFNGADSFQVVTGGSQRLLVNNTYVLANNQMRSPIYYDNNDTAYYGDFASTSQMNRIDINDYIRHRGDTNTFMGFDANDSITFQTGGAERVNITDANTTFYQPITVQGDVIGDRFVDRQSNSYYVNPADTAVSGTFAGGLRIGNISDYANWDDNSGNGGIGIAGHGAIAAGQNPTITVSGNYSGGYALLYLNRIDPTTNPTNNGQRYIHFYHDGTSGGSIRGDSFGNLYNVNNAGSTWGFWTSGYTETLIADDSGNVMVQAGSSPTYTDGGDNTALTTTPSNPVLHVGGSIYLNGNDDGIIFGRGTASFLKDEELAFGWGGGWYMQDGTYLRVRNNKTIYSTGDAWFNRVYAQQNQAYYLDPDGDSQLNTVDIDDYIRHRGDTNTYIGFAANDTFRVWTNGNQRLNIDNDSADFSINVYAPRYYDSNDNAFYADPAGTSIFRRLNVYSGETTGELNVGRGSTQRFRHYITDGIGYIQYWQDETDGTDHSVRFEILSSSSGANIFQFNRPIVLTSNQTVTASKFIDSDDTRYYLDPNATGNPGNISGVFNGAVSFGLPGNGTANNAEAQKGRWLSIEGNADTSGEGSSRIFFTEHNSTTGSMSAYGMSLGYRGGSTSIVGADGNTWTGLGQISNGQWGLWGHDGNATGQWAMRGPRSGSFVQASGSFRAPIFYDSNNTNFYVDPNSSSRMDTIVLNDGVTLRSPNGDYGSFAIDGAARNGWEGFSIGDRMVFMHDNSNTVGVYNDVDNEWIWYAERNSYMRLMYNGGEQARTDNGYFRANNQLRTPIFYDLNNTAFYVDPNSTSNIQNLIVNGTFTQGGYEQNNPVESRWYQQGTYSYSTSQTPNTQYYWIPVGVTNNGGAKGFLEYYAKDDVNYSGNVIGRIVISSWNNSSISIDHHTTGPLNSAVPKVRVDNNNRIWMQMDGITWDSYVRWHWVAISGITIEDGSARQLTTPANSIEILTGQQVRATLGNVTGASVTNTRHHFGEIEVRGQTRSPIYYDLDNTGYFGDFASRSRFNTLELGNQGALTSSTSYPLGIYHNNRYLIGFRNSGADANYPWLVHDNVNGKSAFIIHFNGKGDRFYVDEDGDTVFSGDITADEMFARRFVDTDNNSYFVDPASNSFMASITLQQNTVGQAYAGVATQPTYYIGQQRGDNDAWKIYGESPGGTNTGNLILQSEDDYDSNESIRFRFKRTYGAYDTNDVLQAFYNYVYSPSSFRSPIFYDSNNTAYYANPASQSHFNTLTLQGNRLGFVNSSFDAEIRVSDNNPDGTGATFEFWGDQVQYNAEVASEVFRATRHMRAPIYYDGNDANFYLDPNSISILNDVRASIFYDRDNTNYYVNPAGTSVTNVMRAQRFAHVDDVSQNDVFGLYFSANQSDAYAIYREGGAWTNPYPDLRIAFHTGIKFGANASYQGMRFYTDYNMVTQVMSVNNSSDPLGGGNVYVNNNLQAGSSLRAPIFYDSNNTNFYANPLGTSRFQVLQMVPTAGYNSTGGTPATVRLGDETNNTNATLQESRRPDITLRGQYPQLNIMSSRINNGTHGPTLRFVAYDSANASSGNFKHWVIGTSGTNATSLHFGYSPNQSNPHYGIGQGWSSGNNVSIFWIQNDRNVYAENDMRARRFVDRDNTSYFTHPADRSDLYDLRLRSNYVRTYYHSGSNFVNGTLVRTSIPATATNGASYVLEATGKSYSGDAPFSFIAQGYLYANTIINHSGQHFGKAGFTTMRAFENGGVLCFWWPRVSYWNSFAVHVRNANGDDRNLVTSVSNSSLPSYSKGVTTTMRTTAVYNTNINTGDMYATRYYDSNNTAYYGDFASTSRMNEVSVNRTNHLGGAPAYFYTSSGNLRGYIRATESNDSHFEFATSGGEDFIFRDGGFGGSWNQIIRGNGHVLVSSRFDTPIMYDRNNTGYYVNPAGASQFSSVYANDWFRPQGGTGVYWQDYGYGIRSAGGEGNPYGNIATYNTGRNGWSGYGIGTRWTLMSTEGNNWGMHDNSRGWNYYYNGSYHRFYYGYVYSSESFRAPIFYDLDNTGYYGNFAGDTNWQGLTARGQAMIGLPGHTRSGAISNYGRRPNITGDSNYWTGSKGWGRVNMNTVGDWGSGFFDSWSNPPNQPSGTSHWVGVQAYHYTNGSARYGWQLAGGPIANLRFRNTWSGFSSWKTVPMLDVNSSNGGSMYAGRYYDSNNTGYYGDFASTSRMNVIDINEGYNYGWWRNRNAGQGLYNQSTGRHFYSPGSTYWHLDGASGSGGLIIYDRYNGSQGSSTGRRGYLYYNSSGFGLLNSSGNWGVRLNPGNSYTEIYNITYMNDARANIYYDRGNTGYYANPAGTSLFNENRNNQTHFGRDSRSGYGGQYGTYSSYFKRMAYMSFDWNANYDYYYYHGLSSTDINGSFTDSMSLNSFNDINLRLDSNNNNGNSYVRIHDNGYTNAQNVAYIGREGGNAIAYFYNRVYGAIFYDSNDGGYYLDLNSTSNSAQRMRGGVLHGPNPTWGRYLYVGGNGHWTSSYASVATTNGNLHLDCQGGRSTYINWYVGGTTYINGTLQVNFIYDRDNTGYYVNPASTSRFNAIEVFGNAAYIRGSSPTLYFRDTNHRSAMIHNNSNLLYILRGSGNDSTSWSSYAGYWPVYWNLGNNDATFGGSIWARTNITAYSDERLKENVETIDGALDKVLNLRGVYYNWKSDEEKTRKVGVVAQEVEPVLPEVVMLHQDAEDKEGTLAVDYGNITAVLIEAVKEQQELINNQKEEISELKEMVSALMDKLN